MFSAPNESLAEPLLIYAVGHDRRNPPHRCTRRRWHTMGQLGPTSLDRSEWRGPVAQSLPRWRGCRIARGAKSFARLGAIVSLRSCPRGQAGRVKMGKAQETLSNGVRDLDRGCSLAGRSSGPFEPRTVLIGSGGGWERPRLSGSAGPAPAGARAEVRPGAQTSRFRSRRRDEDAPKGC
jgi:hypothetical protein